MTVGEMHTDEMLCTLAAAGDQTAEEELAARYSRLVRICARPYFLTGGDSEDLIQEGMIGLLSAIRTFRPDRDTKFATYAEVCVRNRILAALRWAVRDKNAPLNYAVPLTDPSFEEHSGPMSQPESPEDVLIGREEQQRRVSALYDRLSRFEKTILESYLNGLSYREIADLVGKPLKSVDNAVQRIRRKVESAAIPGDSSES